MGFKIQHALKESQIGADGLPENRVSCPQVDQSLFDLTAMLVKHSVITLEDIWPHLEHSLKLPEEITGDEIEQTHADQVKGLDYLYQLMFKTIMNAEKFEQEMKELKIEEKHVQLETRRAKMHCNFKLRLLQSCVNVNDWEGADEIANGIYDGKLDLTWSKPLLDAIFKGLDWCIASVYRAISPATKVLPNRFGTGKYQLKSRSANYFFDGSQKCVKQATDANEELIEDLKKILRVLGVYIAYDEKLFLKVLKVVHHAL